MKYTVDGQEVGATTAATIVEEVNPFSGQDVEELRQQWVNIINGMPPQEQPPTKAMQRGLFIERHINPSDKLDKLLMRGHSLKKLMLRGLIVFLKIDWVVRVMPSYVSTRT